MSHKISVISPVYMGEPFLNDLVKRILESIHTIEADYEIILVNDASPDNSWMEIKRICEQNSKVIGIKLSRNFGQHYAISAGLSLSTGEWVVVVDCDLQDRPEEIPKLFDKALKGYDIVLARRAHRKDGILKRAFSFFFYTLLTWLSGAHYDHQVGNFGIYNRKVVSAILSMGDKIRYFPSMVNWVGFEKTSIDVVHAPRDVGKSNYNFQKLLRLAMDIILSYSEKPIHLVIKMGLAVSTIAILFSVYTVVRYLQGSILVPGYTSLIISIWFFSGILIAVVGVVGLYVGKTFQATKNRPLFIAEEILNRND